MSEADEFTAGLGWHKKSPLSKVEKEWATKAHMLLVPYRNDQASLNYRGIDLNRERADDLEMRIAEALVRAHEQGRLDIIDAMRRGNPD